jgi:dihydrodipicolinate synthase/N-acetylneuraminate lyase
MVMIMPPYHGATIRVPEPNIVEFFQKVSDAIDIPIMIQDAPVSGTTLSASLLAKMATDIANVSYFKIETAGAASTLRELIKLGIRMAFVKSWILGLRAIVRKRLTPTPAGCL